MSCDIWCKEITQYLEVVFKGDKSIFWIIVDCSRHIRLSSPQNKPLHHHKILKCAVNLLLIVKHLTITEFILCNNIILLFRTYII
jgi:hypothetical protein